MAERTLTAGTSASDILKKLGIEQPEALIMIIGGTANVKLWWTALSDEDKNKSENKIKLVENTEKIL